MAGMRPPRRLQPSKGATRREWTLLLGAAPLLAQSTSSPVPAPVPTPGADQDKAKQQIRRVSERLAQLEVPMNVEPAFSFRP